MINDNVKARHQLPDATYVKQPGDEAESLNAQEYFYNEAYKNAPKIG